MSRVFQIIPNGWLLLGLDGMNPERARRQLNTAILFDSKKRFQNTIVNLIRELDKPSVAVIVNIDSTTDVSSISAHSFRCSRGNHYPLCLSVRSNREDVESVSSPICSCLCLPLLILVETCDVAVTESPTVTTTLDL
eukprot:scaffold921_cov126-Cylindrotheca_fusiformis.AAC.6